MPTATGSSSTSTLPITPDPDRAVHHVPKLKAKNRRANSEATALHVAMSNPTPTPTAVPFDVKSILPVSKPLKSFSRLQEASSSANKHTRSQTSSFQCIDGEARTFYHEPSPNSSRASEDQSSSQNLDTISHRVRSSDLPSREQFTAFGIEAYPTSAIFNEICYDFVSQRRWCHHGRLCNRIHPLHKRLFLPAAIRESVQFSRMRAAANVNKEHDDFNPSLQEKSDQPADPDPSPYTSQAHPDQPADAPIRVRLPPSSSNSVPSALPSNPLKSSPSQRRTSSRKLSRSRTPSTDSKARTRPVVDEGTDGHHSPGMRKTPWGNRAPSDTSSSSGDSDGAVSPLYPAHARFWEAYTEASAWYTDEEVSAKEVPHPSSENPAGRDQTVSVPSTTVLSSPAAKHRQSENPHVPPEGGQATSVSTAKKHPRPKNKERCSNWLHNRCTRGYDCNYVHDDLEYDDEQPEPPRPKQPDFTTVLHNHMHLRFGPGFEVAELRTGFESKLLYISRLPRNISDGKLKGMLQAFGEVVEIRRPSQPLPPNSLLKVKVLFSKSSEAYKAFTTLHNSHQFGQTLECRMSVDSKAGGTFINDTAVRIDWEGPCISVFMGYATEELANEAIQKARYTPYGDFLTQGAIHSGIPAVGRVTVKFTGLPIGVNEEGMEIFGPHQGMVTQGPNHKYVTVEDTINGVKKLLRHPNCRPVEVHFRPPPYKECKLRAWAVYTNPNDAQRAAEHLHGRKSDFTGNTRITARHIKTIAFSLAPPKFFKAAAEIKALSDQLYRQGGLYSLNITDKHTSVSLRLCGEDMKVLVRLKSELERMLNGEPLLEDGKVAWDDFFVWPPGIAFLQDLEREYRGVIIDKFAWRRSIRLFGVTEKRRLVREKILEKLLELRARKWYIIPLYGRLADILLKGEFAFLQKELGSDNIILDMWERVLRVRGDIEAFNTATDIVNTVKVKSKASQWNPPLQYSFDECPVCFDKVSSGIKLECGHSWCRNCLKRYLEAAVEQKFFPLKCLGNAAKCTERIPLLTARDVLPAASLDALVHAAFSAHVQTHTEFHFCPTPDCPQVYRAAQEGVFIQCPSCLVRICPNCHTDAHDGLTCTESKYGDDLFKEWADQHNVKRCPGCNMAIEKEEGCNHMICTMCKTHICWVCLQTFPNGDGIYGHMRSEHGDFGLGPII